MTESHDQDQPLADQAQVAIGSVVGPPPSHPPPPPPGAGMMHADEVIEGWASDDDDNKANAYQVDSPVDEHDDGDVSSEVSDEDISEASEDAISVLAQAAVEEAMEAAVTQAQSPGANDADHDSINANFTVKCGEQELTSTDTNNWADVGSRPAGGLSQCYHNNEGSDDSQEDKDVWRSSKTLPPSSLPRLTSWCNQKQPSNPSDDDDDEESKPLQEVTTKTDT